MSAQGKRGRCSNDALVTLVERVIKMAVKICRFDFPLEDLKEILDIMNKCIPRDAIRNLPLLHHACMNPAVTVEMVRLLLDFSPEAAETACAFRVGGDGELEATTSNSDRTPQESVYPIHLACHNSDCPSAVIELLIEKNQSALKHCSKIFGCLNHRLGLNGINGLPLHHYLARSNIDIHVVKALLEPHTDALVTHAECDWSALDLKLTPLHVFMDNKDLNEMMIDVLRYLAETNPDSLRMHSEWDDLDIGSPTGTPLHIACANYDMVPAIVKAILNIWEESTRQRNVDGFLPIHFLCDNVDLGEEASLKILDILLSSHPDSVQDADNVPGYRPIHIAAVFKSVSFCERLIKAHPESVTTRSENGELPIHFACRVGRLDIVQHLLGIYPDSVKVADRNGYLPIHWVTDNLGDHKWFPMSRSHGIHPYGRQPQMIKVIEFLLLQEPSIASKATTQGSRLLHIICNHEPFNVNATKLLFDADPDAILAEDNDGMTPLDLARKYLKPFDGNSTLSPFQLNERRSISTTVSFLEGELVYAHQAQYAETMMMLDSNGWLLIHRALQDNASLGAIKLLHRGNPSALSEDDNMFALAIQIACKSCTVKTVEYLLDQKPNRGLRHLRAHDSDGNLPLHHACCGVNCGVIKYLVGRYPASVEERNGREKLPFHLLCENGCVTQNSPEYIEAVWILIRAKPDAILG